MTSPERELAAFAAELDYEALPADVRNHVGLVVADTVGAVVGGSTEPEIEALAGTQATSNPGDASVLGTATTAAGGHAAMLNATAGTALELDEGHKYAAGHPAIHGFPAIFAEAELDDGRMEDLLAAFVAAYEVNTRVARASQPLDSAYHMHGVWGVVGAAAGVARYRGLSTDEVAEVIRVAPNYALHTSFDAATKGATVRNTYAGASNLAAPLVVDMVESGFTGLENGLERHLGRTSEGAFDLAEHLADLGEVWEVTRGYFKRHAACRYTHPVLDALDRLEADHEFDADDVAAATVETFSIAAELTPTRPENPLEAKFSIPFAVATRLRNGHSRKEAFVEDALTEETFELAERVTVEVAEDVDARVPDQRGARITLTLESDESLVEEVPQAQGGADDPFEEPDLREKFESLVAPVLGDDGAERLWTAARHPVETTPRELCELATR